MFGRWRVVTGIWCVIASPACAGSGWSGHRLAVKGAGVHVDVVVAESVCVHGNRRFRSSMVGGAVVRWSAAGLRSGRVVIPNLSFRTWDRIEVEAFEELIDVGRVDATA
jgi:hypothetical protein